MKKAYLVDFAIRTRVVSNSDNDEDIIDDAIDNIIRNGADKYIIPDNAVEVIEDYEVPYNPKHDDNMDASIIKVMNKSLHLIINSTMEELKEKADYDDECWDFPLEEILDGSVEVNEDIWYWLINGRVYETHNEVC